MILTGLDIACFRNIERLSLEPHPRLNLITGDNGSGKSTVLEAIQCLSTGHSFRTRKARELIKNHEPCFTLNARFTDPDTAREHRTGHSRQRDGSVELRLDFHEMGSMAGVTRMLPVKALTPDSHKLIQEGPDERRRFLDWGMFHMEPQFFDEWKQFRRSLSQRNQLLRDAAGIDEIRSWDVLFAEASESIDDMRRQYVARLALALERRLAEVEGRFHVKLGYRAGWNDEQPLSELLVRHLDYHRRMKTTTDGPHRAEMTLQCDGVPCKQILSRGQQKVLVYLLHLAQLDLLRENGSRQGVVLCDDLTSELDRAHGQEIIRQLLQLQSQVFVSGVDLVELKLHDHKEFHMEHGQVKNVV